MKYSINSIGFIVAERDIYSLGGFIPKGSVGCKVANGDQISQDGECWVSSGDISARPDVRVKDDAYIGEWVASSATVHTDGITEFSGSTVIPGKMVVRNPIADPANSFFAKDSFIGVSMDVLCGPRTTTTAFPFEQGGFNKDVPAGTLFTSASMHTDGANICRTTANLCLGKDTYLYFPIGYNCRVFWGYRNTAGQLAYSGESFAVPQNLMKLEHPTYKMAMIHIAKANGTAMTPAELLATGAKILGHINSSVIQDFRPESASGQYVMDKSSFIISSRNFGLATSQLRLLAGGLYNTSMYTDSDRGDYQVYGTFHNVQRLEYIKYLGNSHRNKVSRDKFISAYDCPLLRVDSTTYKDALADKGDLVLRRCIVPKAEFQDDVINGNTYEDLDFSCANEDLGFTMAGYTRFVSSHKQGIYRLSGGPSSAGFVSHKGNLADTARLFQEAEYIPLDGSIMEQGYYGGGQAPYESVKSNSTVRVRTGKPLPTFGLVFPSLPAGYSVKAFTYLDEDFITRSLVTDPTGVDTTYPYVVMVFRKDDDSAINVKDFIALNRTLRIIDHAKAPEITGSAYVGAGCAVRGDVQLIGDPYVNRLLDVNEWEWGGIAEGHLINGWTTAKIISGGPTDVDRRRLKELIPVEPGANITCNSGYWVRCYFFDYEGNYISTPGWGQRANTAPANAAFAGMILKKGAAHTDNLYIEDSDIPLANVKYLRAFKKRRYITNELDRTSPEDILLGLDLWMKNSVNTSAAGEGRYFKELIGVSNKYLNPKSPINSGSAWSITTGVPGTYACSPASWDAVTKFLGGGTAANAALMTVEIRALSGNDLALSDAFSARIVIEFTPSPRIVAPYGVSNIWVEGTKVRMYDNSVISRTITKGGNVTLKGDAVMGSVFTGDVCMCSNGHSDAIIKLP